MRAAAALLALALPGCTAFVSSTDPVARDQEIIRDILWKLHADERFAEVRVTCLGGVVTLSGRVSTPAAQVDAGRIAQEARDVRKVDNRAEIRPK